MKPGATFLLDWRLRGLLERGQLLTLSKRELQGIEDKDAFPNGTNAAAPSVQSSHDFALVVRGLPNRTKMDRAVGSEKVLSGKE
ncbi:hypothetical protein KIW84_MT0044 (mitochondrion) [Lathyrus oleraceus]|nr:hypothetical protein KIW84_MT0044 [Pisum sativum]